MGMKSKIPKPPQVDTTIQAMEAESAARLKREKERSLQIGKMGRAGTILTGGEGVTEEASVGKTILGGSGNTY